MSAPALTAPSTAEGRQASRSAEDAAELKTDAQMLGLSGIAAAGMIAVAHAEVAAALTAGLTVLATVPLWLRARRVERAVVPNDAERRPTV